jgi:Holliday junction resolvase RusA-like endonuclease
MAQIEFQVLGEPNAQMRHRSFKRGKFSGTYDPSMDKKNDFLSVIQQKAPKEPLEGPIGITIIFYLGRPKSHYGTGAKSSMLKDNAPEFHTCKKDLDNCVKFATDSMNHIFYKDDSQICRLLSEKLYSESPRTYILIQTL